VNRSSAVEYMNTVRVLRFLNTADTKCITIYIQFLYTKFVRTKYYAIVLESQM